MDGRAEGSSVKETQGKLQCHSYLMLTERMFASVKVHNLKVVSMGLTIFGHLFSPSHSWGGYFCLDSYQLFTWCNPTAPHLIAHCYPSYLLPLGSFGNWRFCGTQGWKIYSFSNHSLSQDALVRTASPSTVSKDQFSQLSNDLLVLLLPCLTLWGSYERSKSSLGRES